jgi:ribosomal protein S18 acetylase RimI-like enzyme
LFTTLKTAEGLAFSHRASRTAIDPNVSRKCSTGDRTMHSKPAITIRRATDDDVSSIMYCMAEAFALHRSRYTHEAFLDTVPSIQTIKLRLKYMTVFVAEDQSDGSIVGTISCSHISHQEGHLRGMAVRTSHQGTGVAQQLLERAEAELRAKKCARITLDTTEPLKRAIRFYERNGFRPSGRVTDFFGMPLFEYVKSL